MKIAIVIPAFNPGNRLLSLVTDLKKLKAAYIIIVDDGSAAECRTLFDKLRTEQDCVILRHERNLGKGEALKTGLRETMRLFPLLTGYVTADADGQHSAEDIIRVGKTLEAYPGSLVMGTRALSGGEIPFKSRWGNRITAFVFHFATGVRCVDTQTGLRGIPAGFAWYCCTIPGSRFEFEMNFLLEAAMRRIPIVEVPIRTIYLDGNSSSHFRPFRDSVSIYLNIFKFGLSSVISAVADITLFTLLVKQVSGLSAGGIFAATALARVFSGCLNFVLNRQWVFAGRNNIRGEAAKYLLLFFGQMLASWILVAFLSRFAIPVVLVKIVVDSGLFFLSYHIQRKYVFHPSKLNFPGGISGL